MAPDEADVVEALENDPDVELENSLIGMGAGEEAPPPEPAPVEAAPISREERGAQLRQEIDDINDLAVAKTHLHNRFNSEQDKSKDIALLKEKNRAQEAAIAQRDEAFHQWRANWEAQAQQQQQQAPPPPDGEPTAEDTKKEDDPLGWLADKQRENQRADLAAMDAYHRQEAYQQHQVAERQRVAHESVTAIQTKYDTDAEALGRPDFREAEAFLRDQFHQIAERNIRFRNPSYAEDHVRAEADQEVARVQADMGFAYYQAGTSLPHAILTQAEKMGYVAGSQPIPAQAPPAPVSTSAHLTPRPNMSMNAVPNPKTPTGVLPSREQVNGASHDQFTKWEKDPNIGLEKLLQIQGAG